MNNNPTKVFKDLKAKTILVSREFNAPVELVWRAFTESEILDKWWAPSPWKAETKFQDFSVGGHWLYAMVSPENEKHWGKMKYMSIDQPNYFELEDFFCDEEGNENQDLPASKGINKFTPTTNGTRVEFKMAYSSAEQIHAIVEMGFEQGITICFQQLNDLLATMTNQNPADKN